MDQIADSTIALYRRRAASLGRWVARQNRDDTPQVWIDALQARAGHLAQASWKQYRHALVWYLRETRGEAFAASFDALAVEAQTPPPRRQKLLKRIDPAVLSVIMTWFRGQGGRGRERLGSRIADLMLATIVTGLRPCEWRSVTRPEPERLVVRNAKFKPVSGGHGRGNGRERVLLIAGHILGSEADGAIDRTMAWLGGRIWEDVQPSVSRALKAGLRIMVSRRIIGQQWARLRIYDCRHQFSADAKATLDLFAGEVAAAMGHRSALTAVEHYGKRRHGRAGKTAVRPSAESVLAVSQDSLFALRELVAHDASRRLVAGPQAQDAGLVAPDVAAARMSPPALSSSAPVAAPDTAMPDVPPSGAEAEQQVSQPVVPTAGSQDHTVEDDGIDVGPGL